MTADSLMTVVSAVKTIEVAILIRPILLQYSHCQVLLIMSIPTWAHPLVVQFLSSCELIRLRSVHRSFLELCHSALTFATSATWQPQSLQELRMILSLPVDPARRWESWLLPAAKLRCPPNEHKRVLRELQSVILYHFDGLTDDDINRLIDACPSVRSFHLKHDADWMSVPNLSRQCKLFANTDDFTAKWKRLEIITFPYDYILSQGTFNLTRYHDLTEVEVGDVNVDDILFLLTLCKLRSLKVDRVEDDSVLANWHPQLNPSTLTEVQFGEMSLDDDTLRALSKALLPLLRLSLTGYTVDNELWEGGGVQPVTKVGINVLLSPISPLFASIQDIVIVSVELALDCLFKVALQLPSLKSLSVHKCLSTSEECKTTTAMSTLLLARELILFDGTYDRGPMIDTACLDDFFLGGMSIKTLGFSASASHLHHLKKSLRQTCSPTLKNVDKLKELRLMNISPQKTWTSIVKQKPLDAGILLMDFLDLPMFATIDRLTLCDFAVDCSPSQAGYLSSIPLVQYIFPRAPCIMPHSRLTYCRFDSLRSNVNELIEWLSEATPALVILDIHRFHGSSNTLCAQKLARVLSRLTSLTIRDYFFDDEEEWLRQLDALSGLLRLFVQVHADQWFDLRTAVSIFDASFLSLIDLCIHGPHPHGRLNELSSNEQWLRCESQIRQQKPNMRVRCRLTFTEKPRHW